jgi:hypothetical protein
MKATKTPSTDRPKALDTLIGITDLVIAHRYPERTPTLGDLARVVGLASRSLRISDLDERISVENAATLAVAKRMGVIG